VVAVREEIFLDGGTHRHRRQLHSYLTLHVHRHVTLKLHVFVDNGSTLELHVLMDRGSISKEALIHMPYIGLYHNN
jgi:hypothetical protein